MPNHVLIDKSHLFSQRRERRRYSIAAFTCTATTSTASSGTRSSTTSPFFIEIESSYCLKESFKMHFKGSSPILVIYASRISDLEVLSHKRHESQCKLPSLNLCVVAIYKSYFRFTSLRSISFSWRLYPGGWQVNQWVEILETMETFIGRAFIFILVWI